MGWPGERLNRKVNTSKKARLRSIWSPRTEWWGLSLGKLSWNPDLFPLRLLSNGSIDISVHSSSNVLLKRFVNKSKSRNWLMTLSICWCSIKPLSFVEGELFNCRLIIIPKPWRPVRAFLYSWPQDDFKKVRIAVLEAFRFNNSGLEDWVTGTPKMSKINNLYYTATVWLRENRIVIEW